MQARSLLATAALAASLLATSLGAAAAAAPATATAPAGAPATAAGPSADAPPIPPEAQAAGAAATCVDAAAPAKREAVLLVHGTGLDDAESWAGTYERALPALGYATCAVDLPGYALLDLQSTSAPAIVAAIRTMHARYGVPVDVVTHSQGGLDARFALRYWPDAAALTRALVALAPDSHGTTMADQVCSPAPKQGCTPSVEQQQTTSLLVRALDADPSLAVPKGVGVTSISTRTDTVVLPETGASPTSALAGASNVAVQDVCPAQATSHIDMLVDPTAYALVLDALGHGGTANASRIAKTVCAQTSVAGFDPAAARAISQQSGNAAYSRFAHARVADEEPPLAPYVK